MLISVVLPMLAVSDAMFRRELSSEARKLRGSDDYSEKTLPIEDLKKLSTSFPGEPLARGNSTLDEKASTDNCNILTKYELLQLN